MEPPTISDNGISRHTRSTLTFDASELSGLSLILGVLRSRSVLVRASFSGHFTEEKRKARVLLKGVGKMETDRVVRCSMEVKVVSWD